jgi:hypothetical protein
MKPLTLHILDWRITIGLSFISLLFNFGYFYLIDHSLLTALKMSASSLFSLAAMHGAHAVKNLVTNNTVAAVNATPTDYAGTPTPSTTPTPTIP